MYLGSRFNRGGQHDPNIKYAPDAVIPGRSLERVLSITKTALVYIEEEAGQVAILDSNTNGNNRGDIHVPEPGSDIIHGMLETGYPRIFSPTRSLFEFWREDKKAPEDRVQAEYGFRVESWYNTQVENGALYDFTFFNAMKRTYDDHPEADHVEIREPGSPLAAARIPYDEFVRLVDPAAYAPRSPEYVELWLPRLAMDVNAANWHRQREAKKAEELEKEIAARMFELMGEIEDDLGHAARISRDTAFGAIVDSSLSDLKDVA